MHKSTNKKKHPHTINIINYANKLNNSIHVKTYKERKKNMDTFD